MNAPQNNLLTTGQSVSEVLETVTAKDVPPALAAAHVSLDNILDEIRSLSRTQGLPITSTTDARNEILGMAGKATLVVAGLVGGYAKVHGLTELAGLVTLTPTDLYHGRLNTRLTTMQRVYDAAVGVAAQVADYGLSAARLDDLKAKIAAASEHLSDPRGAVIARRVATEKLAEAFEKLESVLNDQLDPLMEAHQDADPDGYLLYRAARVVIAHPGASSEPEPELPATQPQPTHQTPATHPLAA